MLEYTHTISRGEIISLWEFLKHGNKDHQEWLLLAIEAFFTKQQRPPIR